MSNESTVNRDVMQHDRGYDAQHLLLIRLLLHHDSQSLRLVVRYNFKSMAIDDGYCTSLDHSNLNSQNFLECLLLLHLDGMQLGSRPD